MKETAYEEYLREQNEDYRYSYDDRLSDPLYTEHLESQLEIANGHLEAAKDDMGDLIASWLAKNDLYFAYKAMEHLHGFWFSCDEFNNIVEESARIKGKTVEEINGHTYTSKWPPDKEDE